MVFGGQNKEIIGFFDGVFICLVVFFDLSLDFIGISFGICGNCFYDFEFDVVVQFDVGFMICYVGCDGYCVQFICVGDNLCFLFVLVCVQNVVFDFCVGQ